MLKAYDFFFCGVGFLYCCRLSSCKMNSNNIRKISSKSRDKRMSFANLVACLFASYE